MLDWNMEALSQYERDAKWYSKKHQKEFIAITANLSDYYDKLKIAKHPLQVKEGFIHIESDGILAIDQRRGKQKGKLQETRLYIFSDVEKQKLYLLSIGNKQTQKEDMIQCRKTVKEIKNK